MFFEDLVTTVNMELGMLLLGRGRWLGVRVRERVRRAGEGTVRHGETRRSAGRVPGGCGDE